MPRLMSPVSSSDEDSSASTLPDAKGSGGVGHGKDRTVKSHGRVCDLINPHTAALMRARG